MTRAELEALLEACGGDPARWPDRRRRAAEVLIASDPAARRAFAEAVALDRLLLRASGPDPTRFAALTERTVEAALAEAGAAERRGGQRAGSTPAVGDGSRVIRLPGPRPQSATVPITSRPASRSGVWQSAAALAASLVLGVGIGLTDLGATAALGLMPGAGTAGSDTEIVLSALQVDGLTNVLDEDQR